MRRHRERADERYARHEHHEIAHVVAAPELRHEAGGITRDGRTFASGTIESAAAPRFPCVQSLEEDEHRGERADHEELGKQLDVSDLRETRAREREETSADARSEGVDPESASQERPHRDEVHARDRHEPELIGRLRAGAERPPGPVERREAQHDVTVPERALHRVADRRIPETGRRRAAREPLPLVLEQVDEEDRVAAIARH